MHRHADHRPARHTRRRSARAATALLEVIVAMTILTITGLSAMIMASQSVTAVEQARDADEATRRASSFLDAVALWPRTDLDRHLGDRREGNWILSTTHPYPTLYVVALHTVSDSAHGRVSQDLVRTIIYRPKSDDTP
jgi:type II secretory pathway pseudopilin PulG